MSTTQAVLSSRSTRRGPTRRPLVGELAHLADAGDFVQMLGRSARLAVQARESSSPSALVSDLEAFAQEGVLHSLLAIESLARLPHEGADRALVNALSHAHPAVRRHAAWRLGERLPTRRAYLPLLQALSIGGIDTMHAHRTLRSWSASDRRLIVELTALSLASADDELGRTRHVDLLGVVPGPETTDLLVQVASDESEPDAGRIAAIGALGERRRGRVDDVLFRLAGRNDELGAHAALAIGERETEPAGSPNPAPSDGLRVAQLVLAGGLDGQLSLGGRGETGGVASLLVPLGDALVRQPDIDRVLTVGRGAVTDALATPMAAVDEHDGPTVDYGVIALGSAARPADTPARIWEQLPAIERGLRRALRLGGPVDLLHLRMADAGTLAGIETARALGIPVCFSVAPDPHNVVQSLQSRGELDADRFIELDGDTDVWFRARLVERLASDAERLALFPRARPLEFLEAIGIESGRRGQRAAVVAEGIDVGVISAAAECLATRPVARDRDVLDDVADLIPPSRRHLPLVLSVGRLHPVKGMERVVDAWARDPRLHDRCNLVIVGGDLAAPSTSERSVLDAIDRAVGLDDERRSGLVLLGGRPRADVALLQVATVAGLPGCWAGGGVYADGALKEEFGLAVIESLAAGLVVVAPSTGGPPTYVEHGDTGVLVDPEADLAAAIRRSFELVGLPGRAERARRMVEERYSIDSMAARLSDLYHPVAA